MPFAWCGSGCSANGLTAAPRLSFVGEVRIQNGRNVDLAALYVRWLPLASRSLEIRAGRVPPLVGAFPRRAYGRDNLVLGTPLAFQYVTSLRSDALPRTIDDLLRMRGRGWQPSYPIGSTELTPGVPMVSTAGLGHWRRSQLAA